LAGLEEKSMGMRGRRIAEAAALVAVLLTATWAQAQSTGSINGTVLDNTGAVLPGVTVTAEGPAMLGVQTQVTDASGDYRFPSLPPGTYKLKYELPGFATIVREGVIIQIGFTAHLDVKLNVATVEETVTVTGESPVVDVQNTAVKNAFNAEQMKNLPNARDIWSLIAEAPGMTVTRFDVGGSTAGTQTGYSAYGMSGQNRVQVEGTNTTEGTAAAGFYTDYGAFDEVSFGISSAADASMPVPGVFVNSVLKSGGNQFHGDVYFDYEAEALQGDNVTNDPDLVKQGVGRGTRMVKYYDPNGNVGGPIKRDKLWFFTSWRWQEIQQTTTGWPWNGDKSAAPDFLTRLRNATYKLTYQLNPNNKITHYLQYGHKVQPYRNAGATETLDSVYYQDSGSWAGKVEYNWIANSKTYFDFRAASFGYNWPNYPYNTDGSVGRRETADFRRSDTITGNVAGGYSGYRYDRARWQYDVGGNRFQDAWLGTDHSFKFGWTSETESINDEEMGWRNSWQLQYRSSSGADFTVPYRVVLQNTPTRYTDSMWHHGAFIQDQFNIGQRVTINAGLRWDYYNAFEPEQPVRGADFYGFFYLGQPLQTATGPFSIPATAFGASGTVPAKDSIIKWSNLWAPRFGLSWDVTGDGKTVAKFNAGRFYDNPGVSYSDDLNPIQYTTATFNWIDRNGDRLFGLDELGSFVSLSGGARNSVSSDLRSPQTNEISAFVERQIITDMGVRVGFVYKKINDRLALVDLGRPYSAWSVPRTVVDPGPDGLAGNGDDGASFTAYNLADSSAVSRFEWQNLELYDQSYKNLDVTLTKRMSNRWSVVGSFLYTWSHQPFDTPGLNPNQDHNNYADSTIYTAKVFGTWDGPYGIVISPILRFQAGDPLTRRVSVSTNGGTFNMKAEPEGSYREDNVTIFDFRAEKQFRFGGSQRLGVFFDLYNINNSNAAQTMDSIVGRRNVLQPDGSTENLARFLRPTVIIAPRVAKFGVKFSF
jgi:hypothetical protein